MGESNAMPGSPAIDRVLADPAASFPLKSVLRLWLTRDFIDAARDAQVLAQLFEARATKMVGRAP
ncbi:MAG: hypothetical protein LKF80_14670 [Brevundimonas sp.]|uniref:hypothetical protein n=1 Tax=Brevundimonas sp. TaxID=1871086 RepID=UPI0025B7DFF8|nr:hypothetical protein [Brevundimonas sp.]MCH4269638.1 hypothetical protein [Brevundimonas sp.]